MLGLLVPILMRRAMCVRMMVYRTEMDGIEVVLDWRGELMLEDWSIVKPWEMILVRWRFLVDHRLPSSNMKTSEVRRMLRNQKFQ